MSIPKIIHYCWFGGGPISAESQKCMESWKKYCPDYKIIEWNDQNFDISTNRYAQQAYEAKKYAFVSDYVRLAVLYEYGGIYLDTDVELVRPLDELLELPGFMGFQTNNEVATGLGFGARKGNSVVQALLRDYDALDFLKADGSADLTPCPERNTRVLQALGVRKDGTRQSIAEMEIFPAEYFCPMDLYSRELRVTPKTYSIHRYAESWKPKPSAVSRILQRLLKLCQCGNHRVGEALPAEILVGVCRMRAHGEDGVEQKHALLRPACQISAFCRRNAEISFQFLIDILQRRRQFYTPAHRKSQPVCLPRLMIRVLPENHGAHARGRSPLERRKKLLRGRIHCPAFIRRAEPLLQGAPIRLLQLVF